MRNNILNILKLIRIKNLFIVMIMNVFIKIFILNKLIEINALNSFDFCIYLITLILIIAGGYIINDIYDVEIDKINKPNEIIVNSKISTRVAWRIYYLLNILAITSGIFLVIKIDKFELLGFFLFFILWLWLYSKRYKKTFLLGNLQVSFLTSLSVITLAIFDLFPLYNWIFIKSSYVFLLIIVYAIFCFFTTLIREIIKDLEDFSGDSFYNSKTLAIKYGKRKTKKVLYLLSGFTLFLIVFVQLLPLIKVPIYYENLQMSGKNLFCFLCILIFTITIQIQFILFLKKLIYANEKNHYTYLSKLCKIIMITGILSMPFITF